MIVVVGLSHKNAPIEVREKLAVSKANVPEVIERLLAQPSIGEAMVLSTCNRVEVYCACKRRGASEADLAETARAATQVLASLGGDGVRKHLLQQVGKPAVTHLFRVAASLDSLVVGEPQILGQLKDAIDHARAAKSLGATLGNALHRAVRVGKRVRSETAIGEGQVSVSSVAVDLAKQIFGELDRRTTVLVGAGEMAEAAAKLCVKAGGKLIIVNRSPERAQALAAEVGGEPRAWSELERSIIEADIVISSTSSPGYVITPETLKNVRKARKGRSLFLIDIAVPRDIDPAVNKMDNVFLYDVDDLSQIVAESLEGRAAEAARAAAIADEEARGFEAWTAEQALTPAIVALRARTRAVLGAELERSLHGKLRHLGAAEREALEVMLDAATNKLLHAPTAHLRDLAKDPRGEDFVEALRHLFELDAVAAEAKPAPARTNGVSSANGKPAQARAAHGSGHDESELSESA